MNFHYQLIVLGNFKQDFYDSLVSLILSKIKNLGLNESKIQLITKSNFLKDYSGNCPAYCVYIGNSSNHKFADIDLLETLMSQGNAILPVFFDEFEFDQQIPNQLSNHNGFLYKEPNDFEKLVSIILEGFSLLRTSRKLFISYRRSESRSVAIQLFEAFEKSGFDVFLDTHSIRPGEPFQEELWHRMTDCDAIVLLNTPGFLESKWCKEEIAEANCKLIGVVQLIWPNNKLENTAELCLPINLKPEDFVNNKFDDNTTSLLDQLTVNTIVNNVESMRARNLASRQDAIITEFTNAARNLNLKLTLQPERYLSQELEDGRDRIFIPTVGMPQSFNCNQSEDLINEIKRHNVESIHLLYDHIRIRDKWLKHLDWLNKYLEIKTLKVKNVEIWLQHN